MGGGIATIFKQDFDCKQLSTVSFSSFELDMFELGRTPPVLCAVIYRPPKYNKHFISDFSDLLSGIMPKYDHVLILGDMNIHVCCPSKPLASEFLSLIGSFDLVQFVTGPTQEHGHTLDLSYHMVYQFLILKSVVHSFLTICLFCSRCLSHVTLTNKLHQLLDAI